MKKFIATYHAPIDFMEQSGTSSPEEMKKGMDAWMAWAKRCGAKLVDMGDPLSGGQTLRSDGSAVASERQVRGYSVLQAETMDEAKALLDGHPHLNWMDGCEIDVHEAIPMR